MQISVGKTLRMSGAVAAMGLALVASGCSKGSSTGTIGADEMSMGPADAKVTVIDQVMRSQEAMGGEETGYANARPVLFSIGQSLGMSEDAFNKCITDEKGLKRLNDLNQQYMTKDGVNGTPTFVINGKKLDRIPLNIGDFDAALKPALSK